MNTPFLRIMATLALMLLPLSLLAQPIPPPKVWAPGETLTAADLNGNFAPVTRTKRIQINAYGVILLGSATYGHGFGDSGAIVFPDAGTPAVDFTFMVPEDHKPGTDLVLEVTWRSGGTSGAVRIWNNWGTRMRVGTTALDFNAVNSPDVDTTASPVETVYVTEITFPGSNFAAGDQVAYGIFRFTDTSVDPVYIGGIAIRYTSYQ